MNNIDERPPINVTTVIFCINNVFYRSHYYNMSLKSIIRDICLFNSWASDRMPLFYNTLGAFYTGNTNYKTIKSAIQMECCYFSSLNIATVTILPSYQVLVCVYYTDKQNEQLVPVYEEIVTTMKEKQVPVNLPCLESFIASKNML